jgi:murein DD-endopeptidase MepM/ murein hydrolase activator NlpD
VRVASGAIDSNLYASATREGVPESVVSTLVDIFGWEIDFTTDLQPGDTFRVAYEDRPHADGVAARGGRLLAAELNVQGKAWDAIYFEADDDGGNYYSRDGQPFGRALLRYPVEFTRISSQFVSSRFHPVLGVRRPHLGVDFAAPFGTPIRAIAAGRVEYAGWRGGSGRFIKIDHGSGLESSYSHLSSIGREIRPGTQVQVGQMIGKVGASGLATGPHLHFALYRNGVYVNPMTMKLPAPPPLAARFRSEFLRTRDQLFGQLVNAPLPPVTARFASADPLSHTN